MLVSQTQWQNLKYTFISIYFSDSVLVHRNMPDFCVLILNLATLPHVFSSNSSLMQSLRFSQYKITSSANRDSFTASFLSWMPVMSSPGLARTVLASTSSTTLNRSGGSGHPFLVLDLRGNVFSLSC